MIRVWHRGVSEQAMTSGSNSEQDRERRGAGVWMALATASAIFWLVHSFAVRTLGQAVRLLMAKMGH